MEKKKDEKKMYWGGKKENNSSKRSDKGTCFRYIYFYLICSDLKDKLINSCVVCHFSMLDSSRSLQLYSIQTRENFFFSVFVFERKKKDFKENVARIISNM